MQLDYRSKFTVYRREIFIRLKVFRVFIIAYFALTIIGAIILHFTVGLNWTRSYYEAISLIFFASSIEFPADSFLLQLMWILYPMIGIILLAEGLSNIGVSLRFGDTSSREWNISMAKIMNNHTIIVGIGNVGLKVLKSLVLDNKVNVLVIDKIDDKGREDQFEDFQSEYKIPMINGDASRHKVLEEANISRAKAIIVLVNDDLLNVKIALLAKKLNPEIRTVVRMFDLEFGKSIKSKLGLDKLVSTSSISVPHFVKALELD
jgi:hypothetical protein